MELTVCIVKFFSTDITICNLIKYMYVYVYIYVHTQVFFLITLNNIGNNTLPCLTPDLVSNYDDHLLFVFSTSPPYASFTIKETKFCS
jgi:hypothetical protein